MEAFNTIPWHLYCFYTSIFYFKNYLNWSISKDLPLIYMESFVLTFVVSRWFFQSLAYGISYREKCSSTYVETLNPIPWDPQHFFTSSFYINNFLSLSIHALILKYALTQVLEWNLLGQDPSGQIVSSIFKIFWRQTDQQKY